MRLITLKEVAAMEPGEVVPGIRAQIKEVKHVKRGSNEHGDWTIQTLTLMDSTAVAQVKLFDCPEYTAQWQGAWIVVESNLNDKGKLSGIFVSTYRNKKEVHVKGKSGAVITQATDASPANQPAAAEPAKMPRPAQVASPPVGLGSTQAASQPQSAQQFLDEVAKQKQQTQTDEAPKTNGKHSPRKPTSEEIRASITNAKVRLGQAANGLILCYDAAIYIGEQVMKNHPDVPAMFTPDVLEKLAVHLSIALERTGLVMGLPAGPLEKFTKAKPDQTPPDTAEGGVG